MEKIPMTSPGVSPIVITIVRKSDGRIEPRAGIRTPVPSGAAIEFRPGGGATSVTVHFDHRSPIGDRPEDKANVTRGVVKKGFDPAAPDNNVYSYRCELEIGGEKVEWPPKGAHGLVGGEIEIIR